MCRLTESVNSRILTLMNLALSSVRLFSNMCNHWRFSTHVNVWYCGFCPCVCICMLLLSFFGPSSFLNKVLMIWSLRTKYLWLFYEVLLISLAPCQIFIFFYFIVFVCMHESSDFVFCIFVHFIQICFLQ